MQLGSYLDAGVVAAVELVNGLVLAPVADDEARAVVVAALRVDPPSVARLRAGDLPGFTDLAERLHGVFADLDRGDIDGAAGRLNVLLARHPAHPHLARDNGQWRVHHHPVDAELVPMWTAICAEGVARVIGAGEGARLGTCRRPACGRVFVDVSKNGSRRFCSITCQNRVKAAAFRRRQVRSVTRGF
ncbi:MAG TPA: CGNR zinc finger domain-containing protein [Acidimicrobiales bacterium]|nr:CGNR zinc finger domain-containing protein [Acidimicrobiales bacterium]